MHFLPNNHNVFVDDILQHFLEGQMFLFLSVVNLEIHVTRWITISWYFRSPTKDTSLWMQANTSKSAFSEPGEGFRSRMMMMTNCDSDDIFAEKLIYDFTRDFRFSKQHWRQFSTWLNNFCACVELATRKVASFIRFLYIKMPLRAFLYWLQEGIEN